MTLIELPNTAARRSARLSSSAAGDQMSALIERMALSPEVDAAKLDRLLAYQDQGYRDKAKAALDAAYANLQLALPIMPENGEITDAKGVVQQTYALWEDINEEIKPLLSEHGFSLWFRVEDDSTIVTVTAVLSHLGGHFVETTLRLPVDLSGGKNAVHAIGSSTSYGKRYSAAAVLNLTSRGEDDDAAAAAPRWPAPLAQVPGRPGILKSVSSSAGVARPPSLGPVPSSQIHHTGVSC